MIHIFWDIPEDEGIMILQNAETYLSEPTVSSQKTQILKAHMVQTHSLPGVAASVESSMLHSSSPS